jgi:hypothetical protein
VQAGRGGGKAESPVYLCVRKKANPNKAGQLKTLRRVENPLKFGKHLHFEPINL